MSITNELNQIKNAIYGKEVRGAIHDAIKQVYDDASVNHDNANMEVKLARGTHDTLNDRLVKSEQKLDETNAQSSHNANLINDIGTSYSNFTNFSEMENYINSRIINNGGSNHDQGQVVIDLPAGNFEVNDIDILSKYTRRTGGLKFRGRGSKLTHIYFNPSENDKYLFKNNDTWLSLRFEGISFYGNLEKNTNFMLSISNGGAQNYMFTDCFFRDFNRVIDLKGTNNNSEFSFYSCNFNGIIKDCLYCGSDVGSGGDQFLNYNFFGCNYEVYEGNFVNMYRGGNINVWGGSFIHIDGDSETARGGTFFKLPYNSHAYGVERLLVIGARFELRNRNSKLINCAWNKGNVSFINCDLDCYNKNSNSTEWVIGEFKAYDVPTNIKFDNCSLMGKIKLLYNPNTPKIKTAITFDNCRHSKIGNPEDFFIYETNPSTGFYNFGKKPIIHIKNCFNWVDTVLNYSTNIRAVTNKKLLFINNINGSLPRSGEKETVRLPLGSIITKVGLYMPPNVATSGMTTNFNVYYGDNIENLLLNVTKRYSEGFNESIDTFFVCDTELKATITLIDSRGIDQTWVQGMCYIEYI